MIKLIAVVADFFIILFLVLLLLPFFVLGYFSGAIWATTKYACKAGYSQYKTKMSFVDFGG